MPQRALRQTRFFRSCFTLVVLTAALPVPRETSRAGEKSPAADGTPSQRRFLFRYHVTITGLPPETVCDLWIPIAASDAHQRVFIRNVRLPGLPRQTRDKRYGNRMFYVKAKSDDGGRAEIAVDYEVVRREVTPQAGGKLSDRERKLYVRANRLVPLGGKPLELLPGKKLPGTSRAAIRSIYDLVDKHVRYHKPAGGKWGRGDAEWVCDSRFGNCSDFHSLFISLCRTAGVPARFRIGFPIPAKPRGTIGGYHCWAEFADGDRWFSVDISEADKNPALKDYYFGRLSPDRVHFSTGRDLVLEPKQKSDPLNFFIYPHVEVGGKVHTQMEKRFSYQALR